MSKHKVMAALCKLELDNHKRVIRLLMRAMLGPLTFSHRVEANLEVKRRREAIKTVKQVLKRAQTLHSIQKHKCR